MCDLWSLGVIVFIILTGYMPFTGSDAEVVDDIKAGKYKIEEGPFSKLSAEAKDFLQKLLQVDPQIRLSAEQALEHPWIANREASKGSERCIDESVVGALCNFASASRFRRACMSMMAVSLTNDDRSQVRGAFVAMDRDNKGTLTLPELRQVLQKTIGVTDAQVKCIFEALDDNNDDEVNYTDFLAAMMSSRIAANNNLIVSTFAKFDKDNSGYITSAELREVLGTCVGKNDIDAMIEEADVSKDGKISLEEFSDYLSGSDIKESHQQAASALIDAKMTCGETAVETATEEPERQSGNVECSGQCDSSMQVECSGKVSQSKASDKPITGSKTCLVL